MDLDLLQIFSEVASIASLIVPLAVLPGIVIKSLSSNTVDRTLLMKKAEQIMTDICYSVILFVLFMFLGVMLALPAMDDIVLVSIRLLISIRDEFRLTYIGALECWLTLFLLLSTITLLALLIKTITIPSWLEKVYSSLLKRKRVVDSLKTIGKVKWGLFYGWVVIIFFVNTLAAIRISGGTISKFVVLECYMSVMIVLCFAIVTKYGGNRDKLVITYTGTALCKEKQSELSLYVYRKVDEKRVLCGHEIREEMPGNEMYLIPYDEIKSIQVKKDKSKKSEEGGGMKTGSSGKNAETAKSDYKKPLKIYKEALKDCKSKDHMEILLVLKQKFKEEMKGNSDLLIYYKYMCASHADISAPSMACGVMALIVSVISLCVTLVLDMVKPILIEATVVMLVVVAIYYLSTRHLEKYRKMLTALEFVEKEMDLKHDTRHHTGLKQNIRMKYRIR